MPLPIAGSPQNQSKLSVRKNGPAIFFSSAEDRRPTRCCLTAPAFVWLVGRVIRALIFDFDGLIIDTETPLIDALAAIHERAGYAYSRTSSLGLVGHVGIKFDPWTAFGPNADRAALEKEHHHLYREMCGHQPILPGVLDYLNGAKSRGLKLGVASNSSHRHVDGHLTRLSLIDFFDLIRCRDDVQRTKPEPDLYLAALAHFGCAPTEAIAFEDSAPGTVAARTAGVWTVAVPNPSTHQHNFSAAHLVVTSLAAQPLAALIDRFTTGVSSC
jgi:HAD superfamily hydrolase (TIGR01509 family)